MKRKRILIIDDEKGILTTLSLRLKSLDFEVLVCSDGQEGLEMAIREVPDLMILDLILPKLTGEEVCKAIREDMDETLSNLPIIMLTGKDTTADKVVGKVIGANAYLTKPFDFEVLVKEIKKLGLLN